MAILADKQDPHELARERLRPLIDTFEAPIDYAVAYGSGVIHQANRDTSNDVSPVKSNSQVPMKQLRSGGERRADPGRQLL